jgi:hypothetical protein
MAVGIRPIIVKVRRLDLLYLLTEKQPMQNFVSARQKDPTESLDGTASSNYAQNRCA